MAQSYETVSNILKPNIPVLSIKLQLSNNYDSSEFSSLDFSYQVNATPDEKKKNPNKYATEQVSTTKKLLMIIKKKCLCG